MVWRKEILTENRCLIDLGCNQTLSDDKWPFKWPLFKEVNFMHKLAFETRTKPIQQQSIIPVKRWQFIKFPFEITIRHSNAYNSLNYIEFTHPEVSRFNLLLLLLLSPPTVLTRFALSFLKSDIEWALSYILCNEKFTNFKLVIKNAIIKQ